MIGYSFPIIADTVALLCLAEYSVDAFGAIWPGFVVYFNLLMFPFGVVKYLRIPASRAVAEKNDEEMTRILLVALLVTAISGVFFVAAAINAKEIFSLFNHPPELQALEASYFKIMCFGAVFQLLTAACEGLLLARMHEGRILRVRIIGLVLVIALMPVLVLGWFGFPRLGIEGAAYATVLGEIAMCLCYVALEPAFRGLTHRAAHKGTWTLLKLAAKIGIPSGIERGIEESAWTVLILFIGTAGTFALALGNVAINVLELVFFPALAFGEVLSVAIAASPQERATVKAGLGVAFGYGALCMAGLLASSNLIVDTYFAGVVPPTGAAVSDIYREYFFVLGACMIAESMYTVMNSILLAKEDTVFPMLLMCCSLLGVLVVPLIFLSQNHALTAVNGWQLFLLHMILLTVVNAARYFLKWGKQGGRDHGNTPAGHL